MIAPKALAAPALLLAAAAPALADVTLPPILSEHAVLQAGRPVPVWGRADPGERVRVSARGRTAEAILARYRPPSPAAVEVPPASPAAAAQARRSGSPSR